MITLHKGLAQFENELPELHKCINITDWHIGGSTAINGEGNDVDAIILVDTDIENVEVHANGWVLLGEESYHSCGMFKSYRKGDLNIIITDDEWYYEKWKIALNVCIWMRFKHGLSDRDTRVDIHSIICDMETD